MILLKDNHVDFAGGIDKAINRAKEYCKEKGKDLKIEIEVRNFDELQQVLNIGGVDRIMFDNFTPENTKIAVEMIGGKYETESSGGITFDIPRLCRVWCRLYFGRCPYPFGKGTRYEFQGMLTF